MDIVNMIRFHPFFQGMNEDEIIDLLKHCRDQTYDKMDIIFDARKPREGLLLLLSGIAEVYVSSGNHIEVLEVVQKGEITGFSSLADFLGVSPSGHVELIEVRATEPVHALHIPFEVISKRWDDPNLRDYLLTQIAIRLKDIYSSLAEQVKLSRQLGDSAPFVSRVQDIMTTNVISTHPNQTIKELARQMIQNRTSSILVMEDKKLKGIITERDLVERVIGMSLKYDSFAREIMTENPVTISRFAYCYDALSFICLKGVKHLPVIDDKEVVGVVSLSDILRKTNTNIIRTIQQIETATEQNLSNVKEAIYAVLKTFLLDQVPILRILEVITELYDRLVKRCIELAINANGSPPSPFCVYQMGSSGRKEQFLLTDQDHFLVYEECEKGKEYFARFAVEMVRYLEIAGYAPCLGNMMASSANWRGSISHFESQIRKWSIQATNANLLLAQTFFSYRLVYGSEELHANLEKKISHVLNRSKIFLYRLTQVEKENQIPTLEQPIRSLFKLARKQIDIKKEILFPFHHSLQILALVHGNLSGTPLERIDFLKNNGVITVDFAKDVTTALSEILKIYIKQRFNQFLRGGPSTSILHFAHLTTREKEDLILSLKTLKELQGYAFAQFSQ